ncbi:GNAT family N-acetyltransferase [Litoricola sp.]|nr:GNAT family N-acetyltransferase [Litorivicinus sp.]
MILSDMDIPQALTIRKIRPTDSLEILKWRNDSVTRFFSKNQNEVGPDEHEIWFSQSLSNPRFTGYIGHFDETKLGFCFFLKNEATAYVSINLNPEMRGKNFGPVLLKQAIKKYRTNYDGKIFAEINQSNAASIACFSRCGFICIDCSKDFFLYQLMLPK